MKLFIASASILTLFLGLSSCEKHDWDKDGKGVVELFKSEDAKDGHGHDDHHGDSHAGEEKH